MESKFEFIESKDYVLTIVSGEADLAKIMDTVFEAYKLGKVHDCSNFLTDCSLLTSGRSSTVVEEFELIEFYKKISKFNYFIEAIVLPLEVNAREGLLFFETISANRGMMVKTFATIAEAENWLQ